MKKTILLLLFFVTTINCVEYIYPIDVIDDKNILVIYQKNLNHLELFVVNIDTGIAFKQLMSSFNPAGVKISPDKRCFIFLDGGKLRIKEFIKRSPGTMNLDDPIYNFHPIVWVNNEIFYFSAKCGNDNFAIFCGNTKDKSIKKILNKYGKDYLFPIFKNNQIFICKRKNNGSFKVISYALNDDFEPIFNTKQIVFDFCDQPIAFLLNGNNSTIYLIKHSKKINYKTNLKLIFSEIHFIDNQWKNNDLFDIFIPMELINHSETRLYESILPLLPKCFDKFIFYSSAKENDGNLELFVYNTIQKIFIPISEKSWDQHYFSPILIKNKIVYGGNIGNNIQFTEDDNLKIILPQYNVQIN